MKQEEKANPDLDELLLSDGTVVRGKYFRVGDPLRREFLWLLEHPLHPKMKMKPPPARTQLLLVTGEIVEGTNYEAPDGIWGHDITARRRGTDRNILWTFEPEEVLSVHHMPDPPPVPDGTHET